MPPKKKTVSVDHDAFARAAAAAKNKKRASKPKPKSIDHDAFARAAARANNANPEFTTNTPGPVFDRDARRLYGMNGGRRSDLSIFTDALQRSQTQKVSAVQFLREHPIRRWGISAHEFLRTNPIPEDPSQVPPSPPRRRHQQRDFGVEAADFEADTEENMNYFREGGWNENLDIAIPTQTTFGANRESTPFSSTFRNHMRDEPPLELLFPRDVAPNPGGVSDQAGGRFRMVPEAVHAPDSIFPSRIGVGINTQLHRAAEGLPMRPMPMMFATTEEQTEEGPITLDPANTQVLSYETVMQPGDRPMSRPGNRSEARRTMAPKYYDPWPGKGVRRYPVHRHSFTRVPVTFNGPVETGGPSLEHIQGVAPELAGVLSELGKRRQSDAGAPLYAKRREGYNEAPRRGAKRKEPTTAPPGPKRTKLNRGTKRKEPPTSKGNEKKKRR